MIDTPADLFILRGIPGHVRSDNGPELIATAVKDAIAAVGAKAAWIEKGNLLESRGLQSLNPFRNGL